MSNKQVFTAYDVYGFKKALALHAAKRNALEEKWLNRKQRILKDLDDLQSLIPSQLRSAAQTDLRNQLELVVEFLTDLAIPCDLFISRFEEVAR